MNILVYGAGVLGSYLAHVLVRGGNNVTMLARGSRIEELTQDGVVIRHYFQRKTTIDRVNVISALQPDDVYDLIFVVMLYSDLQPVLPVLAANQSRHIVLVGNNADARAMQHYLTQNSPVEKQIAFGFQATGGWREAGRMICIRMGGGRMDIGGLDGNLSWRPLLEKAFARTRYKLAFYSDIDPWLKSHIVLILTLFYATYASGGNLQKISRKQLQQTIKAADEGHKILEELGYTITPAIQAQIFRTRQRITYIGLKIFTKTFLTRLVDPRQQVDEINELHHAFTDLKRKAGIATPDWDALKSHMPADQQHG